jgi:hypothetical protein
MKAIATAAWAAIVLTFSIGATAAGPPHPSSSKPSSYAPRHSKSRVYGAPIQPPIVGHRKPGHHKAMSPSKRPKATPPKAKKSSAKPRKPAAAANG